MKATATRSSLACIAVAAGALGLLLLPAALRAQSTTVLHLESAEALDRLEMKHAEQVVKGLDAAGLISFDGRYAKVRLTTSLDTDHILRALNAGTARFALLGGPTTAPAAMPVLIHTGDAIEDQRRYDEAKRAWLMMQQEEHERNSRGGMAPSTQPQRAP